MNGTQIDEADWRNRSSLQIAPGRWKMRNGHVAEITAGRDLHFVVSGEQKRFPIWAGRCTECSDPMTWNANGTYAAVGKNPFDLMEMEK